MKCFIGLGFISIALGFWWHFDSGTNNFTVGGGIDYVSGKWKVFRNTIFMTDLFQNQYNNSDDSTQDTHLRLAEYYEKKGFKELALRKYKQLAYASLEKSVRDRAKFHIARLQLAVSYYKEGTERLYFLLSQTDDSILRSDIYCELGIFDFGAKDFEKARKNFELSLHENSHHHKSRVYLARTLGALGKKKQAREVYEYYLTYHSALDGDKDKNQELLERIFKSNFTKDIFSKKNSSYSSEKKAVSMDVVDFQKGLEAFQMGNYSSAISIFSDLVTKTLDKEKKELSKYYLAESYYQREEYEQALHCYDEIITEDPVLKDEQALLKKGQILFRKHDYKNAITTFWIYKQRFPEGEYVKIIEDWLSEIKSLQRDLKFESSKPKVLKQESSFPKDFQILLDKQKIDEQKNLSNKVIFKNLPSWEEFYVTPNHSESLSKKSVDVLKYHFPGNDDILEDSTDLSP